MIDSLCLDLVAKNLVTDQITVSVGYDKENIKTSYTGEIKDDRYGRKIPKHAHGTVNIGRYASSAKLITQKVLNWYDSSVNKKLTIRRFALSANHITDESSVKTKSTIQQMDLFTDHEQLKKEEVKLEKRFRKGKKTSGGNFETEAEIWEKCCIKRYEFSSWSNWQRQK